jgi:hypothetical protein
MPEHSVIGHGISVNVGAQPASFAWARARNGWDDKPITRRPASIRGLSCLLCEQWGVVGVTKVAAREFASQGIRVNAIAPGSIDTPLFSNVVNSTPTSRADYEKQTPMGRIAKSEEVAAAAMWLCSNAASYVTGAVIPVDGGMTL